MSSFIVSLSSSLLLLIFFLTIIGSSFAFSTMPSSSPSTPQVEYPRHIHPGGYSLPPLVEDRLSIITKSSSIYVDSADDEIFQTDLLLIKPPDSKCAYLMCCFIFFFSLLDNNSYPLPNTIHYSGIIMGVVCIY